MPRGPGHCGWASTERRGAAPGENRVVGRSEEARSDDGAVDRGYSALELMVSILLLSFILLGLYSVLFQTQVVFETAQDSMDVRQEARVAIDQLSVELRVAGYDLGNLTEAIATADTETLAFVADIDDGSPDPPCAAAIEAAVGGGAERITYRHQSGDLLRTVECWDGTTWTTEYSDQPVAGNLQGGAIFRYFDDAGAELVPGVGGLTAAQRALVRRIRVTLDLLGPDPTAPGQPAPDFQIRTEVDLRNAG